MPCARSGRLGTGVRYRWLGWLRPFNYVEYRQPEGQLEHFVGQPVFVVVESTGARWGRIQSLRVDDADVQELAANANAPTGVGVGLDFRFPKSADAKLVALAADDDVVWSPLPAAAPAA